MKNFKAYLRGCYEELRKATWPSRDETIVVSISVFVFLFIFSAFLFSVDYLSRLVMEGLLR